MVMEERVSRLEGAYEQVDKRLDDLKQEITTLRGDVGSLRDEMRREVGSLRNDIGSLRDEMRSNNGSLRDEMRSNNESLRNEMRSDNDSLRSDNESLCSEMNNRMNNVYILLLGSWLTLVGMMVGLFLRG